MSTSLSIPLRVAGAGPGCFGQDHGKAQTFDVEISTGMDARLKRYWSEGPRHSAGPTPSIGARN